MATKRRSIPYSWGSYTSVTEYLPKPPYTMADLPSSFKNSKTTIRIENGPVRDGNQSTVSESHGWFQRDKNSVSSDVGGPFKSVKSYVTAPNGAGYVNLVGPEQFVSFKTNVRSSAYGAVWPNLPTNVAFPPDLSSSDSALIKAGTTAISRCKPTNSVADLGTFIGEVRRDGLPKLPLIHSLESLSRDLRKKPAEEYLNVEFGWKPVLQDAADFFYGITHTDEVIRQYERDAGKVVRRRYSFPVEHDVADSRRIPRGTVFPYGATVSTLGGMPGDLDYERTITRKRWFSGAFTYHLPSGDDNRSVMGKLALVANRFGLDISPELVWNLSPWSWAADWFGNSGDYLSNLSSWASDGLVMRYGYMMETTIVTDTYTPVYPYQGFRVPPLALVTMTKKRIGANPFGFGVSWSGLSPQQLSIAAALGLSR